MATPLELIEAALVGTGTLEPFREFVGKRPSCKPDPCHMLKRNFPVYVGLSCGSRHVDTELAGEDEAVWRAALERATSAVRGDTGRTVHVRNITIRTACECNPEGWAYCEPMEEPELEDDCDDTAPALCEKCRFTGWRTFYVPEAAWPVIVEVEIREEATDV